MWIGADRGGIYHYLQKEEDKQEDDEKEGKEDKEETEQE